jgi:hypothetical protein
LVPTKLNEFTVYSILIGVEILQTMKVWFQVLSGNIETVQIKEKAKFPQDFFPDVSVKR